MLLLATIYILLLNYYSRSLPTETQKFFGNKFSESVKHFGNFRKYFSPKISLYTVFSKLFPEMKHVFLLQTAVLEVQNKLSRYSTRIEQSCESHPAADSIFLVRLVIETRCIIFHRDHLRVNYIAIH